MSPVQAARERARDWRTATHEAVCDSIVPWEHGKVVRASRYPEYYEYNLVRVTDDPSMSVDELVALADDALAGLAHRRIDFDLAEAAEPLRAGFHERGWHTMRLVWMRHEAPLPPGPEVAVEEAPFDAVRDLRVAWHKEDFNTDPTEYLRQAREIQMRHNARLLAVMEDGAPVGFAQLERHGDAAEITHVYVRPDHRGGGRGTALTRAAIEAAGDVKDLWIVADDEDRPKELYARLGFRPAWVSTELTRLP